MPTSTPNFNFLALLVSEIKKGVPKFNVGATNQRTPKPLCVLQVLGKFKQPAKFQHRISMHHAFMRICISHRLFIIIVCPTMGVLGVKMWKYYVLTPKRHYPAWIRVCWCIACQNRFNSLSSRSLERFCIQRNKNKNLAIANRSRVSCAHNTLRASIGINITQWPWNQGLMSLKVTGNGTIG